MPQFWTIALAVVASFAISTAWYIAFGGVLSRLSPAYAADRRTPPWTPLVEVLRSAVVAVVVALAVDRLDIAGVGGLVPAALVAWLGFPVVLLTGSVVHEQVPWRLAAVHAGDWLLKLVAITLIVGLWG